MRMVGPFANSGTLLTRATASASRIDEFMSSPCAMSWRCRNDAQLYQSFLKNAGMKKLWLYYCMPPLSPDASQPRQRSSKDKARNVGCEEKERE